MALRVFDEKMLVIAIGVLIVVLNHSLRLFGTLRTTDRFLSLVSPYLIVALFAAAAVGVARCTHECGCGWPGSTAGYTFGRVDASALARILDSISP